MDMFQNLRHSARHEGEIEEENNGYTSSLKKKFDLLAPHSRTYSAAVLKF